MFKRCLKHDRRFRQVHFGNYEVTPAMLVTRLIRKAQRDQRKQKALFDLNPTGPAGEKIAL